MFNKVRFQSEIMTQAIWLQRAVTSGDIGK